MLQTAFEAFKNDEGFIGYPYEKINMVACVIERGLDPQLAFNEGVTPGEFEGIRMIHALSEWKRENLHEYPIFD